MMNKNSINLLQADLFPKEALLTLKRVVVIWLTTLATLLLVAFVSQHYATSQASTVQSLQSNQTIKNNELAELEVKVRQNQADSQLVDQLNTLKLLITNKQALHQELTNSNTTYVAGFAKAMNDLSNMHSANISLTKVIIEHNDMTFSGMARTPEAVPAWLALFESSTVLSGKVFSHFKMSENDSNFTDFVVSTTTSEVTK